jgi:shikimate dehydrogenase
VVVPKTMTVLGAGGTAQAALAAAAVVGVEQCAVLVRDPARTAEVRATAGAVDVRLRVGRLRADAPELAADLVVSALPPGAADPLAGAVGWRPGQAVLDVVYDPWPTPLATAATAAGARVLSGALLLLHQAAAQVGLMTGQEPPVPAMREALRAAAPGCGA